ncbi:MAG: efflux RND transporter permease subunit [Thiogranum sp.]|nr:efflux RND transporter permease subunit [Thiogranum sp.]
MTEPNDNNQASAAEHDPETLELLDRQEVENKPLGIAGRMACTFIDSPISPLLMMAALAIGLLGLVFTPRQEDPQISVPMIDIFVSYPGASASQVASLVTEPLERIMHEIPGVRHVYSISDRGSSMVTVRFRVGEQLGPSIVKVHDKLQSNIDKIPPGVAMPLVKPKGIDDVPVVTVTLSSSAVDDAALRTLGVDVLQHLQQVPNTGQGFVVGGRAEQVRVEVLPEKLTGYGLTLDQIAQTIQASNQKLPVGSVEAANTSFSVYTGSFLRTADDISRLIVGTRSGLPIYIRDVARVSHGPEEARQMVGYYTGPAAPEDEAIANGEPAVTVALAKKEGTNGVTVASDILGKLESLRGQLIPDNVRVSITRDYGQTANDKVNELLLALFEAAVAVAALCLIGLGFRAAFVVITVIPIVILITVWSAWVLDYTIDRVSLFALIFSIGILVDDATVVVENIFRRWMQAGRTTVGIAIDAVREVGNPTILATLTIISALLPMGFVSGLMGPYMRPIPVLGSSAMFFSLISAFIFTPWFAMRMRPATLHSFHKAEERERRTQKYIGKIYEPIIMPLIRNRALGILFLVSIIAITALACSMFYFKIVAVKMLPFDNKPEFNVVVNMPEGTAMPVTANVVQQMAETMRREIPEVTALQTYVGTASPFNFNGLVRHYYLREQPWYGDVQVMLLDKDERERSSHEISVAARELLTPIAERLGARIQVVEMPPGPPVLQTVVAEIYNQDDAVRRQVARDMTRMFTEVENLVDVDNYLADPYTYWEFQIDLEKAVRRGVTMETVNRNLAMAMGGHKLGDVKLGAPLEPTFIVIQAPLAVRSQVSRLSNLPIPTADGGTISLAELGRFVQVPEDPYIYHKDLRPVEYVTGEMTGRLGAPIYGMFGVEDLLENYTAPDGVKITGMPMGLLGPPENDLQTGFEWAGEWTVTYETFRDMGIAFMAALLLIYGLIVIEFRDYALSGLIMAPIPLTLIGIIPGHWLLNAQFTATSMIGFIALGGIIVRNSILLVEFVKSEVATGKPIREAAVAAGRIRLRPILITSLTLMAGAAAIIGDPIFEGMAVTLLFGTGVATLFTLIVIPMGCISAEKRFVEHGCAALEEKIHDADEQASRTPA